MEWKLPEAEGRWGGGMELLFSGYSVSIWDEYKALKTLQRDVMLLNCTFCNV